MKKKKKLNFTLSPLLSYWYPISIIHFPSSTDLWGFPIPSIYYWDPKSVSPSLKSIFINLRYYPIDFVLIAPIIYWPIPIPRSISAVVDYSAPDLSLSVLTVSLPTLSLWPIVLTVSLLVLSLWPVILTVSLLVLNLWPTVLTVSWRFPDHWPVTVTV